MRGHMLIAAVDPMRRRSGQAWKLMTRARRHADRLEDRGMGGTRMARIWRGVLDAATCASLADNFADGGCWDDAVYWDRKATASAQSILNQEGA